MRPVCISLSCILVATVASACGTDALDPADTGTDTAQLDATDADGGEGDGTADGHRGCPGGPPPEAIEACLDAAAGDACSFTGRLGETVTSTCTATPIGILACGGERPPRVPPAEALAACDGGANGDTCAFTLAGGTAVSGTCGSLPDGSGELICVPPHHHRAPPPEALAACEGDSDGDACAFVAPDGRSVEGACRSGSDGATLACVPAMMGDHQR